MTTLSKEMKLHAANCVRCRKAERIGRLCAKGKQLLDRRLVEMFPLLGQIKEARTLLKGRGK